MDHKPFSQACENNKQPILDVLKKHFANVSHVLEIGSGTGQHAVFMSGSMPHLKWQPSDRDMNIGGINEWVKSSINSNLLEAIILDVEDGEWPKGFDAVYTANTAHIMSWEQVQLMFSQVSKSLSGGGVFVLYGPFNYRGEYTSESNQSFDQWLKNVNPLQGIRDFEDVELLAEANGFSLLADEAMPANNRTLIWRKVAQS